MKSRFNVSTTRDGVRSGKTVQSLEELEIVVGSVVTVRGEHIDNGVKGSFTFEQACQISRVTLDEAKSHSRGLRRLTRLLKIEGRKVEAHHVVPLQSKRNTVTANAAGLRQVPWL